jgi:hypothetical protein
MVSSRNFRNRSGICNKLSTEGPLMLKKDPLVGAARITCHNILTKRRDTSSASFRSHQGGLAGCSENYNTLYSSNKCDSCTVEWERRYCVHKHGFRQISDLSGNVRNRFLCVRTNPCLFPQKVPLLRMLEQDKGTKALFIYPTKVSPYPPATIKGMNSLSRLWLKTKGQRLNSCWPVVPV